MRTIAAVKLKAPPHRTDQARTSGHVCRRTVVALEPVRDIGAHGKNFAFDFMPEHAGQLSRVGRQGLASTKVELSLPHMQLTVAHARVLGADQHLRTGRYRKRVLCDFVGFAVLNERHRLLHAGN